MQNQVNYDLKSVSLPRLMGTLLRLFVVLLESPLTRPLLIGTFLKNGGIDALRRMVVDEPPTLLPLVPPPDRELGPPPDLVTFPPSPDHAHKGFAYATVWDYAYAYRSSAATPEQVARRLLEALDQSERLDPPLRAFIAVNRDDLLHQAEASTERFQAGAPLSIFDGVPVAVKDEVDMAPYPTTVGTKFLGKAPVTRDSTVVARMRAAGALLVGKANMHEIGITPTGLNIHHGTPRNPHNPAHYTGGSSSGSAAAVAAGLCPVAIGADGGGSIRIPAAFCGIVGLKATFGRVSECGAAPLCWSVAHLGPLAATAEDAALAYAVMAGADSQDPNTLSQPAVTIDGYDSPNLRGLRLGIYRPWFEHAIPSIVAACNRVVEGLKDLGAEVVQIAIPELDAIRVAHVISILSEMGANMDRYDRDHRRDFDPSTRLLLVLAREFTGRDYIQAQRIRTRAMRHFAEAFKVADVILTPTTAITAPEIPKVALRSSESDTTAITEMMRFVNPANLTGLPAISFVAGYDESGLPIGCHAMGRPWEEHLLLRIAHATEQFVERRRPQVYYDLLGEG